MVIEYVDDENCDDQEQVPDVKRVVSSSHEAMPLASHPTVKTSIGIVGVGGAGGSILSRLMDCQFDGLLTLVANTDCQALSKSRAQIKIPLGEKLTKGLGAGGNPDVAAEAASADKAALEKALKGLDLVFIVAGMGGGTGTGAAPVIASIAKDLGIIVVGAVTTPAALELSAKRDIAQRGVEKLSHYVDAMIEISNEELFSNQQYENLSLEDLFAQGDRPIVSGVRGIMNIIEMSGALNVDFADVRAILTSRGRVYMGTGVGEGEHRVDQALEKALGADILGSFPLNESDNLLINVVSQTPLTTLEFKTLTQEITGRVKSDANVKVGVVAAPSFESDLELTLIASCPLSLYAGTGREESAQGTLSQSAQAPSSLGSEHLGGHEPSLDPPEGLPESEGGFAKEWSALFDSQKQTTRPASSPLPEEDEEEVLARPAFFRRHLR